MKRFDINITCWNVATKTLYFDVKIYKRENIYCSINNIVTNQNILINQFKGSEQINSSSFTGTKEEPIKLTEKENRLIRNTTKAYYDAMCGNINIYVWWDDEKEEII